MLLFMIGILVGYCVATTVTLALVEKSVTTAKQALENCNKVWAKATHAVTREEYAALCEKYDYKPTVKDSLEN